MTPRQQQEERAARRRQRERGWVWNPYRFGNSVPIALTWSTTKYAAPWVAPTNGDKTQANTGAFAESSAQSEAWSTPVYFEVDADTYSDTSCYIGIVNESAAPGVFGGTTSILIQTFLNIYVSGGTLYQGNAYPAPYSGARFMFADDPVNGNTYVGVDGTWSNLANPGAGTGALWTRPSPGGSWRLHVWKNNNANVPFVWTIASATRYPVPSGFSPA